jgi:hypothetical protein
VSGSRCFDGMFLWDMTEVADFGTCDLLGGINFAFLGVSNWRLPGFGKCVFMSAFVLLVFFLVDSLCN